MGNNQEYKYEYAATLSPDSPSYVVRKADKEFYQYLKQGEFCYVFNARKMGKSSLQVKVSQQLETADSICATISLDAIGKEKVTIDKWYWTLIKNIERKLKLKSNLSSSWWKDRELLTCTARFKEFIEKIVLKEIVDKNIVIFIDEIDFVIDLEFSASDFFAAIRHFYNERATKQEYKRLTFALLGVATPSQLINDKNNTPFNIGKAIKLEEIKLEEAMALEKGIAEKFGESVSRFVLREILKWTGGQPFLTQKLCYLVVNSNIPANNKNIEKTVARIVKNKIINNWDLQDNPEHLVTIRNRIENEKELGASLLELYLRILKQESICLDESWEQAQLLLSGLVIEKGGKLVVYSLIYREVFNEDWILQELDKLRPAPYQQNLEAWINSKRKDKSRLLTGQALIEGSKWIIGKDLQSEHKEFLAASHQQTNMKITKIALIGLLLFLGGVGGILVLFNSDILTSLNEKKENQYGDASIWEGTWECNVDPNGADRRTIYLDGEIQGSKIIFTYKDPLWDKPQPIAKNSEEINNTNLNLRISEDNFWDLEISSDSQQKATGKSNYLGEEYDINCQKVI